MPRSSRRKQSHVSTKRGVLCARIMEATLRFGCAAAVIGLATVTYQAVTTRADAHHEFIRLHITPAASAVHFGEERHLTAAAEMHSPEMPVGMNLVIPVTAHWAVTAGDGTLQDCDETSRCTFRAGNTVGSARVEATVELPDGREEIGAATIDVTAPPEADIRLFEDQEAIPPWALPYIMELTQRGIIHGNDPQPGETLPRFDPSGLVTRGQIVTLLTRIMRDAELVSDQRCAAGYEDVPAEHYAHDAIGLFRQQGWTAADTTVFQPDDPASRAMAAAFIDRPLGQTMVEALGATRADVLGNDYFDDIPADHPSHDAITVMRFVGAMSGQGGAEAGSSLFDPEGDLNRSQSAAVIFRIMHFLEEHGISELTGYDADALCASDTGDGGGELTEGVDLTVSAIELSPATPAVGDRLNFRFTVQNLGNEDAGPTRTKLHIDKENDGTWNIGVEPATPAVPAGGSVTVDYPFTPNPDPAQAHHIPAGTHRLELCADYDMHFLGQPSIEESNEDNNCREMVFTVQ